MFFQNFSDRILIAICFASVMVWIFNHYRLAVVTPDHKRLAAIYGEMDIGSGTEFVVVAIPTDSPYTFAWRCYIPPNGNFSVSSGIGKSGVSGGKIFLPIVETAAAEYRHSIHFDLQVDQLETTVLGYGTTSVRHFGNARWSDFLKKHWNELDFHVLAGDQNAARITIDPPTQLLRIRIPESLRTKLEEAIGKDEAEEFFEYPFFQASFHIPVATPKPKAQSRVGK